MSITFTLIRLVETVQVDDYTSSGPHAYSYFESLSIGWTSGARWRTKKFVTLLKFYEYLNKLLAGSWIDDDSYNAAWLMALQLEEELVSRGRSDLAPTCGDALDQS